MVGLVFYSLGRLDLGRVVYFFPSHVLVRCISSIGAFLCVMILEIMANRMFSFTVEGFDQCIAKHINLLAPVVAF